MPTYHAIITTVGAAKLAAAAATYTPLQFLHMAVGDGSGLPTTPTVGQTALVRERARVDVNRVYVDPADPNQVRIEGLFDAATGGFTIREAGVFDADGDLIIVANYPDTYKPTLGGDGISVQEYIQLQLVYANPGGSIDLTIDPSVVMATQADVDALALARVILNDDFTGDDVDSSKWIAQDVSGGGSTGVESRGSALGVLAVKANAGGHAARTTRTLNMGVGFFDFRARAEFANVSGSGTCFIGIHGSGGDAGFFVDAASSTTKLRLRILNFSTIPDVDTTVFGAVAWDLRMKRDVNGFWFYVNGTLIQHAPAYAPTLDGVAVTLRSETPNDMYVDRVTLVVPSR